MKETAAILYAALAALPAAMHIALAAGAPLGRFTIGGRFAGRLPPVWRCLAVVQAAVLAGLSLVVLRRGEVIDGPLPEVLFWPAVGLTALSFIANAASPSLPERRLWTPVIFAMLAASVATGLL